MFKRIISNKHKSFISNRFISLQIMQLLALSDCIAILQYLYCLAFVNANEKTGKEQYQKQCTYVTDKS